MNPIGMDGQIQRYKDTEIQVTDAERVRKCRLLNTRTCSFMSQRKSENWLQRRKHNTIGHSRWPRRRSQGHATNPGRQSTGLGVWFPSPCKGPTRRSMEEATVQVKNSREKIIKFCSESEINKCWPDEVSQRGGTGH